jgi:ABC-type branched-subunit amino acid transport system ATPase component/sugar phosphate permease
MTQTSSEPALPLAPELKTVGLDAMGTRDVFRSMGYRMLGALCLLNLLDNFAAQAFGVLAPDIQETLQVSDTVITLVGTLGGLLLLVGAVPAAIIADRVDRTKVISITSLLLAVFTCAMGLAQNVWQLVIARFGSGICQGNIPAFNSLITDAVPIAGRARAFAIYGAAGAVAGVATPLIAGAIAEAAGGPEGWRWAFTLPALPLLVVAVASLFLRDPGRGRSEQAAVLGIDEALQNDVAAPRLDEAFARIKRIKSYYFLILGFCALGVGLFVIPTLANLYLEEEFGLGAVERGAVGSISAIGGLLGALVAGAIGDRLNRSGPKRVLEVSSIAVSAMLLNVVAFNVPSPQLFVVFSFLAQVPLFAVFTSLAVVTGPIMPPRLRSVGFAFGMLYLAVFGGVGGAILTGVLSDEYGPARAVTIVMLLIVPVACVLMRKACQYIDADVAAVEQDIRDEQEQRELRLARPDGPLPGEALLDVRRLDFSYGSLQVLFDVNVEVRKGEVLALLGTNGAGKSTLLRAVTGLGFPDRGVVRFGGADITYKEPAARVRLGIVQVPGGKAIFPTRTVEENLRVGGYTLSEDLYDTRRDEVLELFSALRPRLDQPAGTMSGGERQMLALAKGMLLDPQLLCIDELSLGLAPIVVEQLMEVVTGLKERGVTMLIVEQSVNVALSLADRAVFMEKGHVQFEGPAQELLERGDLVRAVFLGGGEGG